MEPDFYNDMKESQRVLQKAKQLNDKVQKFNSLYSLWEDTLILIDLANEENDESMLDEVKDAVKKVEETIDTMTLETL